MSTLPTLAKTWQFDVNQEIVWQGTAALMGAEILYRLKESLRAFTLAPWTVRGSSNGVTAGMDTVDRWASKSNITWAADGVARSWIVLQQTGLIGIGNPPTTGFQVLFDCSTTVSTAGVSCRALMSPTGSFTGGSTTARPTAVDEQAMNGTDGRTQQQFLWLNGVAGGTTRLHVMQSSDGECTRWFVYSTTSSGPTLGGWGMYDRIQNPSPALLYPAIGVGTRYLNRDYLFTRTSLQEPIACSQGGGSTTQFWASMTCEGQADATLPYREQSPDELSGEWAMHPCGLYVPNTNGFRGRVGSFNDLWTASYRLMDGTVFPEDDTYQFVKLGALVLPWNGEPVYLG